MTDEKLRRKMEQAYEKGNAREALRLSRLLDKQIVWDMMQECKEDHALAGFQYPNRESRNKRGKKKRDPSSRISPAVKALMLISITGLMSIRTVYASTGGGDLFGNAQNLLNDVYARFVGFSTAAAGIGVGTGVFMRKFSLGKQHQIELGGRIIKDSLVGWGVLNGLGLVINYISNYTQ
jgi:hypothetical protein